MICRRRFLIVTACVLAAVGCSGKSNSSGKGAVLRVGMDLSYPPFEMQDKAGTPDGVSVKLAEENKATTRGLLRPFVEESWAIGIAKGNDALLSQVNAFLDEFRKQDGFGKLGERYLRDEKKFLEASGIPFILR